DEEAYFGDASDTYFVDENGNPIALGEGDFYDLDEPDTVDAEPRPQPQTLDERWIDRATGRNNDEDESATTSDPDNNDRDDNAPNRRQPESLLPNTNRSDGG
ncbi:MAG: hypothetical protein AAGH53_09480, partial [Pseudomonadota bacterium]